MMRGGTGGRKNKLDHPGPTKVAECATKALSKYFVSLTCWYDKHPRQTIRQPWVQLAKRLLSSFDCTFVTNFHIRQSKAKVRGSEVGFKPNGIFKRFHSLPISTSGVVSATQSIVNFSFTGCGR